MDFFNLFHYKHLLIKLLSAIFIKSKKSPKNKRFSRLLLRRHNHKDYTSYYTHELEFGQGCYHLQTCRKKRRLFTSLHFIENVSLQVTIESQSER
nr:MAG TPA: hypothetical protein [Caudoviricetes sp.]